MEIIYEKTTSEEIIELWKTRDRNRKVDHIKLTPSEFEALRQETGENLGQFPIVLPPPIEHVDDYSTELIICKWW